MRRVLTAAVIAVVAAAIIGLLVGTDDDGLRRVGLPPMDETVATVLEDGTPVFVTRDADDDVHVLDARTPARSAPEDGAALADLVDGLVAWCADRGFVDDLEPPATFTLDGRATGPTDTGLGRYQIAERARAHVMVADTSPLPPADDVSAEEPRPSTIRAECDDPERTDDHGQAMHAAELDAIRPGPSWVVEAAVDLGADVLCQPPDDPLAWPPCPDGGVRAELPDQRPTRELAEAHGEAYSQRKAFAFVGHFLVHRDEAEAPLQEVWRLPYRVEARARPREHTVEARVSLRSAAGSEQSSAPEAAPTITGESPLATLAVENVDGDVPRRLPVEPATEVVAGDAGPATGDAGVTALREALDADPDARWRLRVRHDPLRPPRLDRLERLDGPDDG